MKILQGNLHKRINAVKNGKVLAKVVFEDGVYFTDDNDVIKALTEYGYIKVEEAIAPVDIEETSKADETPKVEEAIKVEEAKQLKTKKDK